MRSRSKWKVCCTSTMIVQLIGIMYVQICEAFGLSRAHKVPPVLYKECRKTKLFVTLSWIWNEVKVKMKGMLHIHNDCTIDWHQVCANIGSGLGFRSGNSPPTGDNTDTSYWSIFDNIPLSCLIVSTLEVSSRRLDSCPLRSSTSSSCFFTVITRETKSCG